LEENKRLNRKKDKETLKIFKQDIFENNIPVPQTIGIYFKTFHLPYGQRGGQIDSAQEEPTVRTGGDARMQVVVQGKEASLQRDFTNTKSRRWREI
ncbi:MAG: hypothetical protein ACKPKO_62150, partial [Candidatus Fonsibacter sp.]